MSSFTVIEVADPFYPSQTCLVMFLCVVALCVAAWLASRSAKAMAAKNGKTLGTRSASFGANVLMILAVVSALNFVLGYFDRFDNRLRWKTGTNQTTEIPVFSAMAKREWEVHERQVETAWYEDFIQRGMLSADEARRFGVNVGNVGAVTGLAAGQRVILGGK